ncbi:uncharacterized protein LOC126855851 [Cataglyphis hispanica]|uniref:uncharacterized protein LOC126855851 n=1 Tax=Cataglyphis hispanica TaxID=1086592 RepID=UPI0021808D8E|nr:uncharacterized protein LOC126855851 [Cataglyphis hispanica]
MPGRSTQRLTSFRNPRDLSLSGSEKPKKIYIPNVNVQRNKKKDEATTVKVEPTKPNDIDRGRGRGRGRGDSRHGRNKTNIIQSAGVWSEGIAKTAPTVSGRSYDSSSSRSTEKYLEKSKLDTNKFITNTEEEEKLKKLLNNDLDDDANPDDKLDPISLPRIIKEFCVEEIDEKPIISENGEVINIKKEVLSEQNKEKVTIPQIIENKTNPYVLMQFPECWQNVESNEGSKSKGSDDSNTYNENDNKAKSESHGLNSLNSGLLGKLEILKSGKTRLCIGEKYFFIDINVQKDFQQELLVAKVDTVSLTGDLINLGPVNNYLNCLSDIESLLKYL